MIERDLTQAEMEELLHAQCYAHLGITDPKGNVSVLPISYVYDDGIFYSFSTKGSKLEAMRKHPHVCVQVEELHQSHSWKSHILKHPSWSICHMLKRQGRIGGTLDVKLEAEAKLGQTTRDRWFTPYASAHAGSFL